MRILAVVVVWGRVVAIWSGDSYEGGPSEAPAGVLCFDGTVQTQAIKSSKLVKELLPVSTCGILLLTSFKPHLLTVRGSAKMLYSSM